MSVVNAGDARAASESLFDKTEPLLLMARRWGGNTTVSRAAQARELLDLVRSPTVLLPDLGHNDPVVRLKVVTCLAFLDLNAGVRDAMEELLRVDPAPMVRQTTLWALGLSLQVSGECEEATALPELTLARDADARVQAFARQTVAILRTAGAKGWWEV